MSGRIFQVSKETQGKQRIAELRQQIDEIELPSAAAPEPPPDSGESLQEMVEAELKRQMKTRTEPRALDWTITTSIKFLAVKAKIPIAFGSELDEPQA